MGDGQGWPRIQVWEELMILPLVFRRTAQLELDHSIAWYENKREGLGWEFRTEIEKHLKK